MPIAQRREASWRRRLRLG